MPDMNRFEKAAAERGVKKLDRTKSWGASQTEKATAPATATSRFGNPNLPKERNLAPATTSAPRRTLNGKIESSDVAAARAAMEQDKIDAAKDAQARARVFAMQQDPASIRALFEGWMASRKNFFPSPFNIENMTRALGSVLAQSDEVMSVKLLDDVFEHLKTHGYLEAAIRRRGDPAALVYPEHRAAVQVTKRPSVGTRAVIQAPEVTLPDGADAKTMPLDELARAVRQNYNYRRQD